MNSTIIIAFACVIGASILLAIPFGIMQSKRKKGAANFAQSNHDKAILHLYAEAPVIDGANIKDLQHIRGEQLQHTIALSAGKHTILGKYSCTSAGAGSNINYKTPRPIESEITLEAGHEYSLSIYFYSPEERREYYKGDVGEDIYTRELEITGGGIGGYTKAYIICYKEK